MKVFLGSSQQSFSFYSDEILHTITELLAAETREMPVKVAGVIY